MFLFELKCYSNHLDYDLRCLDFWATFIARGPLISILLLTLISCLASCVNIPCWQQAWNVSRNRYVILYPRHSIIPKPSYHFVSLHSHVVAYLRLADNCTKLSALEIPLFFAAVLYVFRTEPASVFLYSLYRMGFNCHGQGSAYITPEGNSCSYKPTMPGKDENWNFASVLFVQK